jgi:hypothetical protein
MRELNVAEQRYKAVLAVISDGRPVTEVAAAVRVSRQTLHGWLSPSREIGRWTSIIRVRKTSDEVHNRRTTRTGDASKVEQPAHVMEAFHTSIDNCIMTARGFGKQ